jgi:hypothetical protein
MMFFKAVFALYLAAIALAAPKCEVKVRDVGTFRVNPRPLCTSLSTDVAVDGNDIIKGIANDADVI